MPNSSIDDYAKDGDQKRPDIYVVFTMILCGPNFCILGKYEAHVIKLK